jgi:membrane associated rhomboid family serine protease
MVDGKDEREPDEDNGYSRPAPRSPAKPQGWKKWLRIVIALFLVTGTVASIANLYLESRSDRGGELYRSMWGFKVSPIGILVTVGVSVAIFPVISIIEWLLHRRDRALGRKHRRKPI